MTVCTTGFAFAGIAVLSDEMLHMDMAPDERLTEEINEPSGSAIT